MQILKGETAGQFNIDTVLLRPFVSGGRGVDLGDSKGLFFRSSEEEEAVQRWTRHEFLELSRQIAKGWRQMIERIDLPELSKIRA